MDKRARRMKILEMQHKRDEIDRQILELQYELERSEGSQKAREDRQFEEIVVEYPPADLCTYPEYAGKPYFGIKYIENGETFVGFGTYNPDVLTRYLKEYFLPKKGNWISRHIIYGDKTLDVHWCSECNYEYSYDAETGISDAKYCPNCGADMRQEKT